MQASTKMWVAMVTLFVTCMLSMVGMATPSWVVGTKESTVFSVGVWRACLDVTCVSVFDDGRSIVKEMGYWLYAVQVGTALGAALYLIAGVATGVAFCAERYSGNYRSLQFLSVLILVATISFGYGTFLYGYEVDVRLLNKESPFSYGLAFYMSVAATAGGMASALLYFLEYRDQTSVRRAYLILN